MNAKPCLGPGMNSLDPADELELDVFDEYVPCSSIDVSDHCVCL